MFEQGRIAISFYFVAVLFLIESLNLVQILYIFGVTEMFFDCFVQRQIEVAEVQSFQLQLEIPVLAYESLARPFELRWF